MGISDICGNNSSPDNPGNIKSSKIKSGFVSAKNNNASVPE